MRIVIDARMLKPGSMHGIARYVFQLVQGFAGESSEHQYGVLVNRDNPLLAMDWPGHIELIKTNAPWISFREQWELPRLLRTWQADLFHAPSFIAPLFCPCKLIMTIHDLNHIVLSQYYTALHQFYYRVLVRSCIEKSSFILTVSEFSKKEIVSNLKVPENKVLVTYNGVSQSYSPIHDNELLQYVREIYELPERFIFCISNNKPHKNVTQLVRAYCHSNLHVPLVLATPVDRTIIRIAEHYGKKHLIFFTKYINEEHLPSIYSMTDLFVYPSYYEGFGLPPLEALACGAKVVVAKASSLPEVVGNNAIFADPFDYQDIARALAEGYQELPQQQQNEIKNRGIEHAKKYSWRELCDKTREVYGLALNAGNRSSALKESIR